MRIIKSGRTSGITKSKIRALNATVEVNVTATEKAVFNDQIIAEPFSKAGDSGSLVLNTHNQAVGLLFAGSDKSTICNRITNVLDELQVELI
jgi:predicted amino acid-binding ACT domain protein